MASDIARRPQQHQCHSDHNPTALVGPAARPRLYRAGRRCCLKYFAPAVTSVGFSYHARHFRRPSASLGRRISSIRFEHNAHHSPIVFGFGLLGDLDSIRGIDASVAASADVAFVFAWTHLRMPPAKIGDRLGKLDCRLPRLTVGFRDAHILRVRRSDNARRWCGHRG